MPSEKEQLSHSTEAELKFIDWIGTHSELDTPRRELLRGYVSGARKRADWGLMDGLKVIAYAESCLARLVH